MRPKKPKRGRPFEQNPKSETLRVRLTEIEMRKIDAEAKRLKTTRTRVVRRVLHHYLTGEWL